MTRTHRLCFTCTTEGKLSRILKRQCVLIIAKLNLDFETVGYEKKV